MRDDAAGYVPVARRPREWRRALRSLRALLADPDDTMRALEIFDALDRTSEERAFRRFAADPVGSRLLAARPSLPDAVSDRAALMAMPAASFGRAYAAHLDAYGFHPLGLVCLKNDFEAKLRAEGAARPRLDPAREWFRDRSLVIHDLWHVLTGYGADDLGEAALLPFAWAQGGGMANAFLVAGVAVRGAVLVGPSFPRYLSEAWRRGRRAVWLAALPYETLLPEPLEDVRRAAGIVPATVAHPGGIRRGAWIRRPPRLGDVPAPGAAA